jgi:hypothetical protein
MAVLTTATRKALPASAFAGPNRSYPMHDRGHAIAAIARAKQHGGPVAAIVSRACKDFGVGCKQAKQSGQDDAVLGITSGRPGGHAGYGLQLSYGV